MLKPLKVAAAGVVLGLGALAATPALAQRWHGGAHVGVYLGIPLYAPYPPYYYAPPPYYYAPPAVVYATPPAPPVYVERGEVPAAAPSDWYYCPDSKSYYPYVKTCPSAWQRVAPHPPSAGG